MTPEIAQTLAVQALAWVVGQDDLRDVFLGASGASEQDLRNGIADPLFLASLLDFICMDDAWVKEFCEAESFKFNMDPMMARQALPGGEQVNWT